jgi:hypothetical protein
MLGGRAEAGLSEKAARTSILSSDEKRPMIGPPDHGLVDRHRKVAAFAGRVHTRAS